MITVFTSSHSHGKYLPEAIESVLNQTHSDFEYILIDDGGIDDTFDIMFDYAQKDDRIRFIPMLKQPTKGPLLNKSVQESFGDTWVWCPADDVLHPQLLEKKLAVAKTLPKDAIIYSDYWYMNGDSQVTGESNLINYTPETLAQAIWQTTRLIGFTGIWIPMDILKKLPMPEHVKYSEDFHWLLEACIQGYKFHHLKERLYYKRKHKGSVTSQNLKAVLADVDNIRQELRRKYRDILT